MSGHRSAALCAALCAAFCFGALACSDSPVVPPGDDGPVDLRRIVAIGNSLTAGYQDGALYASSQQLSIPALLARQAGVEAFVQPLVADPGIERPGSSGGRLEIVSLFPPLLGRVSPAGAPLAPAWPRPYNNLGVPGALLAEALTAESEATSLGGNPFFDLVLRGRGTWAEQAAELDATFVTVWLGSNDVLGYASRGADDTLAPPISPAVFRGHYGALLAALLPTTRQIALFNIPDVTAIPFITTIPSVVVDFSTLQPMRGPDGQTIPLSGPKGPLAAADLVTLAAGPALLAGDGIPVAAGGTGRPLPDDVVLDVAEQAISRAAVDGYNAVIADLAAQHDLILVDAHALLNQLATTGIQTDGGLLTGQLLVGGAFSLDGIHPTSKGAGLLANALIEAINTRYGARIPLVSIASLPGVNLPGGDRAPDALRGVPVYQGGAEF
ncbi:MAG: SGNH/GDSL hydrolase family protein [Gemmatimonadota bacterium]